MGNSAINRPMGFGPQDRAVCITLKSEMEIRCENDGSGNPVYIGRAKLGVAEDDDRWQISKHTWDGNDSLLTKKWPVNPETETSANYEFVWDDRATYTYQ